MDLGTEAINAEEVVFPTEEKLIGFSVVPTSEQEWSHFPLTTTQRPLDICPGDDGQEGFAEACSRVDAMFETDEGKAVIQMCKAKMRQKPLVLRTSAVEAE